MNKQAPSAARILTMIAFAASCIGLLLFLWISFGGTTSLGPTGYEITAEFDQAENLGSQADIRISGVNVGRVVGVSLDRHTGLTRAVMEIDPQFAPRPADTRAILRQKTLLGETYIELSPGSRSAGELPDHGALPPGQVAPTVQLDQILSTFDPVTRRAFETWMQQQGTALTGRGQDLNAALAELAPFATNVDSVLAVLRRDSAATSTLLRDGGQVFSSIARSPSALQQLVNNSNSAFSATAAQADALAATIRAFPAFLVAQKQTIDRVKRFSVTTKPLVDELRPAAVQLSPALKAVAALAPQLGSLLVNEGPLTQASKAGIPALEQFLDTSVPFLTRAKPYLGGVVPVIDYINTYRREVAAFFANGTAADGAVGAGIVNPKKLLHYVRVSSPINPETLTDYAHRISTNRGNPYLVPGGASSLVSGLPVFGGYLCTSNPPPAIGPTIPPALAAELSADYYTSDPSGPACQAQPPLGEATTGQPQVFPQLQAIP
ncbi:MAG TPA: MlaD family protein [Solirubrobacteraceae bacterium]|nr:MlaD family protein [Solirubrobacteraceae bacterium]